MKQLASLGLASVVLIATLGLGACSSDDEGDGAGGTSGTGGKGGAGATGGSSGSGGSTGGSGGSTGGSGGSTGGSGGSTGGTGGAAGATGTGGAAGATSGFDAAAFCAEYDTICPFGEGNHFASEQECETETAGFTAARQTCIDTHLGLAANYEPQTADRTTHCGHATGLGTDPALCGAP